MKSKFLFGVLMGGLALASCTADEDLTNLPLSQDSPITFSVAFDETDKASRAEVTSDMKVNFEAGDLMSLFHGVTWGNITSGITGYQNAIYEGSAKEGQSFTFTTKSMVLEGGAIMVYPADTTFANKGTAAPVFTIPVEQNAKTKELTPHMSEVLQISTYDGDKDNTAGYGKNYEIVLKRVGTTLKLTSNLENANAINGLDVEPLKVTKVGLEATNTGTTNLFTTSIPVAIPSKQISKTEYPLWRYQSSVDQANSSIVTSATLTTTDVADNVAIFTLLPTATSTGITKQADDASVTVYTNYGTVTLDKDAEVWSKSGSAAQSVLKGINNILVNTLIDAATTSVFAGQKVAGYAQRFIDVDVKNIDMDGLHITDEQHLMDALTVYDAIAGDAEVTFYLDGDDNGEFVMNAEAAAAYEARIADENNKISFKRSQETGTVCTTLKFISTEETEVPSVVMKPVSTATGTDKVAVKLVGPWKFTEKNNYELVSSLIVDQNATMRFVGTIDATLTSSNTFSIINNGIVNVEGTVEMKLSLTNYGTINIPENQEFFVNGSAVLRNDATSLEEYGKIYNSGNLGIRQGAIGKIYNYGFIQQMNANAYTYVTANATGTGFAAAFNKSNNKIGTILLYGTGNYNTVVNTATAQGFIKVITTATNVTSREVGEFANYVVITGDCTECSYAGTADKYIEVQSNERVVFTASRKTTTVKGLIIDEGYSINIPKGYTITATTAYLKGRIYNAGTFKASAGTISYVGYLGGATTDNTNVIYSGN